MALFKNVQKAGTGKGTCLLEVYSLKSYCLETEETVPLVKSLLCKKEDLSSDPQRP